MATMGEKKSRRKRKSGRRRRRKNPGTPPPASRRRRKNPGTLGKLFSSSGGFSLGESLKEAIPAVAGTIFAAAMARNFGTDWGPGLLGNDKLVSPYAGEGWSFRNYAIGLLAGNIGGRIVGGMWGQKAGEAFWKGALHSILTKLVYTEMISRWGTAQKYLGSYSDGWVGVYDDGNGNRYLMNDDYAVQPAMMGVHRRALGDGLVGAGPMGDGLVAATPMGRLGRRRPMGHAIVGDNPTARRHARNVHSGFVNPFHAAYAAR